VLIAAVVLLLASMAPAETPSGGTLVSLECERLSLLVGGAFEYPSTVELSARLVPAAPGREVRFTLSDEARMDRAGRSLSRPPVVLGKVYPVLLSSKTALTDDQGYARVFLVSGDAVGNVTVTVSCNGQQMAKRLTVDARWQEEPVIAPPVMPPRLEIPVDRLELARERVRGLYDPRVSVRTAAKQTLVGLGQAAVPALINVLSDSSAPWDVRSIASRTLAEIRDDASRISLAWALRHPLGAIRYSAAAGLKGITDSKVLVLVEEALKDSSASVRSSTLELMATLPGGIKKVLPLLKDPDPFVRARAAWEITLAADEDAKAQLDRPGQGLFDPAVFVRHAALRGFAAAGTGKTRLSEERLHPGVIAALAHPDGGIRASAVTAAGHTWQYRLNIHPASETGPAHYPAACG